MTTTTYPAPIANRIVTATAQHLRIQENRLDADGQDLDTQVVHFMQNEDLTVLLKQGAADCGAANPVVGASAVVVIALGVDNSHSEVHVEVGTIPDGAHGVVEWAREALELVSGVLAKMEGL